MSFGLRVTNDAGDETLNINNKVLHLEEIINTTTTTEYSHDYSWGTTTISIDNYAIKPLVFVSNTDEYNYTSCSVWKSGPTYWDRISISRAPIPPGTFAHKVFIFSQGGKKSAETHGLRIWDENKDLVFDSGVKTLKYVKSFSGTLKTSVTLNFDTPLVNTPVISINNSVINSFMPEGACPYQAFYGVNHKVDNASLYLRNYCLGAWGVGTKYAIPPQYSPVASAYDIDVYEYF